MSGYRSKADFFTSISSVNIKGQSQQPGQPEGLWENLHSVNTEALNFLILLCVFLTSVLCRIAVNGQRMYILRR